MDKPDPASRRSCHYQTARNQKFDTEDSEIIEATEMIIGRYADKQTTIA
jgi:hypothetical protein